jgi:hypothetical protein
LEKFGGKMYLCGLIKRVEKEIKAAQKTQKTVLAICGREGLFCGF